VFFGTGPANVTHVGIAIGGTLMVNAPTFNEKVRVDDFRKLGDLLGASRPTRNLAT
jgi:cell wall-associated NlpC family hydrolase